MRKNWLSWPFKFLLEVTLLGGDVLRSSCEISAKILSFQPITFYTDVAQVTFPALGTDIRSVIRYSSPDLDGRGVVFVSFSYIY